MMRPVLIALAAVTLLAACSSTGALRKAPPKAVQTSSTTFIDTEAPEALPLQGGVGQLPAGRCGLLLWTVSSGKPALIFRHITGDDATMIVDGKETSLTQVSASGERRQGIAQSQGYLAGLSGLSVEIDTQFGTSFPGGTYVDRGTIRLRNKEGWERVTPVAGIAGCRKAV